MENEILMDDKNVLVMKLLHYFIIDKNYNPIILQGVENEIWLENMDEDYKVVRIVSNYIHNDEQFNFDIFKTKRIVKKIKKKTLSFSMNTLSIFLDLGDNVNQDIHAIPNVACVKIDSEADFKKSDIIKKEFPDLTKKLKYTEKGMALFAKITSDINEHNKVNQKYRFIRFSIFKMLPINLRYDFYRNGSWFNFDDFIVNSSIYTYAILSNTKNFINIKEEGNYYNILHNMLTHEPMFVSSDYLPYSKVKNIKDEDLLFYKNEVSVRHFYANVASMNILIEFIQYLKENNVYDNTKIILVSDHGRDVNTTVFEDKLKFVSWYNALLIYKDFNSRGNIQIDTNFMTIADVPYIAVKHIPNIKNIFNNNIITNSYKTNGIDIIQLNSFDITKQFYNRYNFNVFYNVRDNIFDINNWKKFEIDWETKESKEIELK